MGKIDRMMETARQYRPMKYARNFTARDFQLMIRLEAGADDRDVHAVSSGEIVVVPSPIGKIVCVTCGKSRDCYGDKAMNTGHFIGSRSASVLFEEDNVAPQCGYCNKYLNGNQEMFASWIRQVRGVECHDRLLSLRSEKRTFALEELVEMRIEYKARCKEAKATIDFFAGAGNSKAND